MFLKCLRLPLSLKYDCTSQSTWRLAVHSLMEVLRYGLPIVRAHNDNAQSLWSEITSALDEFLFPKRSLFFSVEFTQWSLRFSRILNCFIFSPLIIVFYRPIKRQKSHSRMNYSIVRSWSWFATRFCRKLPIIRQRLYPSWWRCSIKDRFIWCHQVSVLVNICAADVILYASYCFCVSVLFFIDMDPSTKLREEFAKICFEVLLQFSLLHEEQNEIAMSTSQVTNQLAITSLLHRFHNVLSTFAEDCKNTGKFPLPRCRLFCRLIYNNSPDASFN